MRTLTLALALLALDLQAQDWPAFRGPHGDGHTTDAAVPTRWDRESNVRFRVALKKPANGSPIVSGGRVFLTYPLDDDGRKRALACFDRKDGARLWERSVEIAAKMPTHKTNPYGGSTPAADGNRVVVWHASAGLVCYDFDGKELWRRDLGRFRHRWGYGTSPILREGRVYLHSGPGEQVFLAAFALTDGATLWRHDEPATGDGEDNAEKRLMGSWCTPLMTSGDAPRLICAFATRVVAFDPQGGGIVWSCGGIPCERGDLVYSSPVVAGGRCLVLAGYDGPLLGIRLGGDGDVTKTHRLYRHAKQPSNTGSGIVVGGHAYVPDMRGTLACIDVKSGERTWSERAVKGAIWGSIVSNGERLFVTNQKGTTVVFEPNPKELVVVAKNELGETTNSTPALAGGEIFVRTHAHLWCIGEGRRTEREERKDGR